MRAGALGWLDDVDQVVGDAAALVGRELTQATVEDRLGGADQLKDDGLPGIDLLNAAARTKRQTIFGSMHSIHNMTVGSPDDTLQYQWCIDGDWKLLLRRHGSDTTNYKNVHSWDRDPVRLYNLANDPHERNNLADRQRDIVVQLTEKLNGWHAVSLPEPAPVQN